MRALILSPTLPVEEMFNVYVRVQANLASASIPVAVDFLAISTELCYYILSVVFCQHFREVMLYWLYCGIRKARGAVWWGGSTWVSPLEGGNPRGK